MKHSSNSFTGTRVGLGIWRNFGIAVGVVLAVSFVPYGVAEFRYQLDISHMYKGIHAAKKDILLTMGGVEYTPPILTHGPHFIDKLTCIDINCPQVESSWIIPIEMGKYNDFESAVVRKIQESRDESLGRTWRIYLYPDDLHGRTPPYPAPSGKSWIGVRLFVSE